MNCADNSVNIEETEPMILTEGLVVIPYYEEDGTSKSKDIKEAVFSQKQKNALYKVLQTFSKRKANSYVAFISTKKKGGGV